MGGGTKFVMGSNKTFGGYTQRLEWKRLCGYRKVQDVGQEGIKFYMILFWCFINLVSVTQVSQTKSQPIF